MPTRLNDIETTFHLRVSEALRGLDQIINKTERAEKSFRNAEQSISRLGKSLAAFGAISTAAFGLAIRGALEEEQQIGQLRATIEGIGQSFEAQRPGIDRFIDGLTQVTKFTDNELRPALNRAILATNSVDEGMRAAELGAKVAAAGFGSLEGNATLIARLFEGQVTAIGRLIPEFRDLEERLEAGATESGLAAEALQRLSAIAAQAPAPDALNLLTKSIGELRDAAGKAAFEGLEPMILKLTEGAKAAEKFAGTDFGKGAVQVSAFGGTIAAVAGGFIIFSGSIIKNAKEVGKLLGKMGFLGRILGFIAAALTGGGGVIAAFVAWSAAILLVTKALDLFSKAKDKALDTQFGTERIAQFTAEADKLEKTLSDLKQGLISSREAQKEFNKVGLLSRNEAEERSKTLRRIVASLEAQKKAQAEVAKGEEDAAAKNAARIAKIIEGLEKEKQKNIELDIIKDQLAEKDRKRGEELLKRAGLFQPLPQPAAEPAIPTVPGIEPGAGSISELTEDVQLFAEKTGTVEERVQALADQAPPLAKKFQQALQVVEDGLRRSKEEAELFDAKLQQLVADTLEGFATLAANFFVDLAGGFQNAAENAKRFFKALISDLTRAIAKAIILQAVISALPGGGFFGGVGKKLSGLFQDAHADQLARFEGSRFADLFFQGMFREFNTARDRMDLALTENRDVNRSNNRSMTAIVNEATPETTVEFTDRHVEPRVRERARQRSSRGNLTGSQIDRMLEEHDFLLNQLRTQTT